MFQLDRDESRSVQTLTERPSHADPSPVKCCNPRAELERHTASADGTVRVWELDSGHETVRWTGRVSQFAE
jgi:hypothetical protein